MAKESDKPAGSGRLDVLQAAVEPGGRRLPPLHLWDPPFCGDIDMRIAADGTWFYNGTPIGRPALVRLFASVLRCEGDKHVLVTPAEKVGIVVDDAPFVAVDVTFSEDPGGPVVMLRTNVDDWVTVDAAHPLRWDRGEAGEIRPYVRVRDDLWALVGRAVFYDLVDRGEARTLEGVSMFGVASSGAFFPMAPADAIGFEP